MEPLQETRVEVIASYGTVFDLVYKFYCTFQGTFVI